ncbi:cbb3-type cytochrome oxidase assembly protein CcoS [Pseudomonas tremae]|uniref:Cbb3-type cytochrome oxidase assembly protein CcoS n=2 Tax=Pseudomonas coronafaciens TaxID=53409 RepID=A0AAE6UL29_9PSED|nr:MULTISPECIES: cbb3-type cytochrome oxidase assembly protein CcoS [Pseudomonas syringae group]KOP52921.1 cytochrome C oxidase subunit II [Pseudomonas coronafaciens pv. porri]KOP61332.1 cytochrome C oxidase subunit II [Pseudomonas coronafaciens pv. porri]KPB55952.1 Cytochrome oxidase maturation protein [Pseudomonas coronafaciens pv. oryzae]KPY06877.1 Cytochrome oxidase maturation protein, cbb3-type [Pseudomonas coronafaciens pv. oryzae]KPY18134.1 Cytochrome oxidase maturation protein, cbb3-ty
MPALYILIPAALLLVGIAIYVFFWAVDSGQYDDMEGPAHSLLFDDPPPAEPLPPAHQKSGCDEKHDA